MYIVGYMVGLGDRHVQNILIDKNMAEFINIDLGEHIALHCIDKTASVEI